MKPTNDAAELLARYVELHNESVGSSDRTGELFAGEPRIEVEGDSISPLRKMAIIDSFKSNALMLWEIGSLERGSAFANYAWRRNPRLGGTVRLECDGGHITRLTVKPGYARTFATLSMRPPVLLEEGGPNAFAGD